MSKAYNDKLIVLPRLQYKLSTDKLLAIPVELNGDRKECNKDCNNEVDKDDDETYFDLESSGFFSTPMSSIFPRNSYP